MYSFGVVLLELLTGRKSVDKSRPSREANLVEWARPHLKNPRKLGRVMDPRLEGQYSETGAQRAAALAYQCLSHRPKLRPTMSQVIEVLEPLQDANDDIQIGTFFFAVSTDSDSQKEISSNNGEKPREMKRENGQKHKVQRDNKSPKSPLSFSEMNSPMHHRMRRA